MLTDTRHLLTLVAFLAGLLFAAGCETTGDPHDSGDPARLEGTWTLSELTGVKIADRVMEGGKVPTFTFDGNGRVSGTSAVNRYTTNADMAALVRGKLDLSPIVSTRMAGPPDAMKLEVDFLNTLSEADNYRFANNALELREGSETTMRFVKE